MQKILLLLGALMGFLSVALGAFGAHALKTKLGQDMAAAYEVGARYQMYHAIAIFLSVWISTLTSSYFAILSGWSFVLGIAFFSGSLYMMALTGIRVFGAITPFGGVLLILGWVFLGIAALKSF